MKKQNKFYLASVVSALLLILAAGCEQEGYSAAQTSSVKHPISENVDKSAAAATLQEMIRKSGGLNVYHQGFKPEVKPPCPAPSWTPQEVMEVNEIKMYTIYLIQHWYAESEGKKALAELVMKVQCGIGGDISALERVTISI